MSDGTWATEVRKTDVATVSRQRSMFMIKKVRIIDRDNLRVADNENPDTHNEPRRRRAGISQILLREHTTPNTTVEMKRGRANAQVMQLLFQMDGPLQKGWSLYIRHVVTQSMLQ